MCVRALAWRQHAACAAAASFILPQLRASENTCAYLFSRNIRSRALWHGARQRDGEMAKIQYRMTTVGKANQEEGDIIVCAPRTFAPYALCALCAAALFSHARAHCYSLQHNAALRACALRCAHGCTVFIPPDAIAPTLSSCCCMPRIPSSPRYSRA